MQATFVNCLIHLNHSPAPHSFYAYWLFKNKIFYITRICRQICLFCWGTSKRAQMKCDDILKCLCSNQMTFLSRRRSSSCGREQVVEVFYTIFIPWQRWWCTSAWCPRSGVVLESHVTKFADGEVSSAASFAVCNHLPTSIDLHNLNSDYFPIRFAFPDKMSRQLSRQKFCPQEGDTGCAILRWDSRYPRHLHSHPRSYPGLTHIQDEMKRKANILREQWWQLLEVRTIVHIFKLFAPASNTFLDWSYSFKYKTCNLQIPGGYQPTNVYTWAMMPIWCKAATPNNLAGKKSRTRLADKYGSFNHNGCILLTNTASNFAFTCAIAPQQLAFAL